MAEVDVEEQPSEPPPAKTGSSLGRAGRWTGAVAIMVIALVLTVTSIVAVFARNQILNTDRYVATMAPLATDPVIQAAISNRISNEVLARVDLKGLATQATDWLTSQGAPDAVKSLVGPAVNAAESFVRSEISKIVHSSQFATIWDAANRAAHSALVAVLTGAKTGAVVSSGDTVSINLGPLLAAVKQQLIADGFGLASKIPAVSAQFTIFESDKLPKLRSTVRLLNDVATWLPWITLAIIIGAVFTAPNRRRGIILAGLFIALGLLITRGVIHFIAESAIDDLPPTVQSPEAVQHVLTIVLRNVRTAVNFFALIFGLAAVFAFLFGPSRFSTGLRKTDQLGARRHRPRPRRKRHTAGTSARIRPSIPPHRSPARHRNRHRGARLQPERRQRRLGRLLGPARPHHRRDPRPRRETRSRHTRTRTRRRLNWGNRRPFRDALPRLASATAFGHLLLGVGDRAF